jgi:DNA anti-recombination protein RmuC
MGGTASAGKSLQKLSGSLDDLAQTISTTCTRIENKIDKMNKEQERKSKISELTIEFGLSLTAQAGVVITSASGEATLKVTAKLTFD